MRILAILFLVALTACAPSAPPSQEPGPRESVVLVPSPPDPGPPPPAPSPVKVQVDAKDFVEWGSGGGIDGRWEGTRVYGDGRVVHLGKGTERETRVDSARAAKLLQAAADAGILELKDHPTRGADMLGRGLQASLDGREVSVSMDEMTQDPTWERVWAVLKL